MTFKSLSLTEKDFWEKDTVIQLGFEPNRIDIINAITGVSFETAYKNKVEGFLGANREKSKPRIPRTSVNSCCSEKFVEFVACCSFYSARNSMPKIVEKL